MNQLKHLAIIMDGNRRFARANNQFPWMGHKHGVDAIERTIRFCQKNNILYLSLYTFSLENFNRSETELSFLFSLMLDSIEHHKKSFQQQGVRVRFIGNRTKFPASVHQACQELEEATSTGDTFFLQLLFCYGGQQEIIAAATQLAHDIACGTVKPQDVDPDAFRKYLWTPAIPDPDLIMRTGGQQRLSNFLLYQAAYAELYFTDTYWPALTEDELTKAVTYFYQTKRNFGA